MSYRSIVLSNFEEYLRESEGSPESRTAEELDRKQRMSRFPHAIMLQVSFPELDFANRLCWQHLGPNEGECNQLSSEYRVCDLTEPHSHDGLWMSHWFEKTAYNFGFNEWYFAKQTDSDWFLASVDKINWGEHYPK
jgi:hypothetical protein